MCRAGQRATIGIGLVTAIIILQINLHGTLMPFPALKGQVV
jgi:hypothetical protein